MQGAGSPLTPPVDEGAAAWRERGRVRAAQRAGRAAGPYRVARSVHAGQSAPPYGIW